LVCSTEDVSIVLLEPPHSSETRKGPVELVAMKDSKISHADRKIAIGVLHEAKHDAVAGTVHGLESMLFSWFLIDEEHVFLVLEVVTTHLPQLRIVDIGWDDFGVATYTVLWAHELNESIVNGGAVGIKKGASRRQRSEIEELLFWTDGAVVPLRYLLLLLQVFF